MRSRLLVTLAVLIFVGAHSVGAEDSAPKREHLARALVLTGFTWGAIAEREYVLELALQLEAPEHMAEPRRKAATQTRNTMSRERYARSAAELLVSEFTAAEAEQLVGKLDDPLVRKWFEVVKRNSKRLGETTEAWRKEVQAEFRRALRSE